MRSDYDARARDRPRPPFGRLPVAVALGTLAVLVYLLRGILVPFVLAGALAYVAAPAVDWLDSRLPLRRGLVVGLVFLAIVGVGGAGIYLVGSTAAQDLGGLSRRLSENLGLVTGRLAGLGVDLFGQRIEIGRVAADIGADVRRWLDEPARATQAMRWGVEALFGGALTVVLLFYFLWSGKRLARGALWLVPPRSRPFWRDFARRFDPVLRRYVLGVLAISLYAMIVAWILIGPVLALPDPLLLAVVTGVLEPIPFFGPLLAPIIVGAVALDYGSTATIVEFVVCMAALRLSIDQLVGPLVLGKAVGLPPSVIIFALLAGWVLFGFVGIFLAVPVAAALRTALGILYDEPAD